MDKILIQISVWAAFVTDTQSSVPKLLITEQYFGYVSKYYIEKIIV